MLNKEEAAKHNRKVIFLREKALYERLYCTRDENGNELRKTPMGPRSVLPMCRPETRTFKRPVMGKPVKARCHVVASKFGKELGAV